MNMHIKKRDSRTNKKILQDIEQFLVDAFGHLHQMLHTINQKESRQMADFKELVDSVAKIKGTVNSTKSFIQGLKAKIEELAAGMNDADDQAAVAALAVELGSTETDLAAAIVANDPDVGGSVGGMSRRDER